MVDSVTTLAPGENATVASSFDGVTVHFAFGIPSGANGTDGVDGLDGPPGPPFATAIVDAVTTLDPGENATVTTSFDGTNVHFTFGIPRGDVGPAGPQGDQGESGAEGAQGPQGLPGEVTTAQLDAAIAGAVAGSSSNSNAVLTLDVAFADPDTETLRLKLNELILALRR
jgi:hypothetical protein